MTDKELNKKIAKATAELLKSHADYVNRGHGDREWVIACDLDYRAARKKFFNKIITLVDN